MCVYRMASNEASIPRIQVPHHLPFDQLLVRVAEGLTGEAFARTKRSFRGEIGLDLDEDITDPWDLLRLLNDRNYITEDNVILLQRLVYNIKNNIRLRSELLHSIITYARQRQTFYVEDSTPQTVAEEGFDLIHFHININLPLSLINEDTSQLRNDVARIFGVDPLKVFIVGVLHSNSYVVTLKIPTECAEMIPDLVELGLHGHFTSDVDKIAIGSHMYDVKEKKEVVENVDKHREDFISVYDNLEKRTSEVAELTRKLHQQKKKWENESIVFAKALIEKQLRKDNLSGPEVCSEEADRITTDIVKLSRENYTLLRDCSQFSYLLEKGQSWTKYNEIKLFAMIVRNALKDKLVKSAETQSYIQHILDGRMPQYTIDILNESKQESIHTMLPNRNIRLYVISQNGVETNLLVAKLFGKNCEAHRSMYHRICLGESTWTSFDLEEQGACEGYLKDAVPSGAVAVDHPDFVERLLETMKDPSGVNVSEVRVVQLEDDEYTRAMLHVLMARNAVYLLFIDISTGWDHGHFTEVAEFLDRWMSDIECQLFGKECPSVIIVGLFDDQFDTITARQRYEEKYFAELKNKCNLYPTLKRVLDSKITISKAMTEDDMSNLRKKIVSILNADQSWPPSQSVQYYIWENKLRILQQNKTKVQTTDSLFKLFMNDGVIPFQSKKDVEDFLHDHQHNAGNIVSLNLEDHPEYAVLNPATIMEQYKRIVSNYGSKTHADSSKQDHQRREFAYQRDGSFWISLFQKLGLLIPMSLVHMPERGPTEEAYLFLYNLPSQEPRHIDTPKFGFTFPEHVLPITLFHIFLNQCLERYRMINGSLHRKGCEFYLPNTGRRFAVYYVRGIVYSWVLNGGAYRNGDDDVKECRKYIREYIENTLKETNEMLRLKVPIETHVMCPTLSILSNGDGLYRFDGEKTVFCHFHETPHEIDVDSY